MKKHIVKLIQVITRKEHRYCVNFVCKECGRTIFTMIVRAYSPERAELKAVEFLLRQSILILDETYIDVEQI